MAFSILFIIIFTFLVTAVCGRTAPELSKDEGIKKTIVSKGGDIIDCVDIYKQPAFNSPLLKDHKIQMRPTVSARQIFGSKSNASSPPPPELQQEWQKSGSCPEGTIPILRNTRRQNATAAANFAFHPFPNGSFRVHEGSSGLNYAYAVGYSTRAPYHGIAADVYVWDVYAEPDGYAANYIAIGGSGDRNQPPPTGQYPSDAPYEIAAGWMANPGRFGDTLPRLFLYWSNDRGRSTRCFNLDCSPGFVQTNNKVALGAYLTPPSTPGGTQTFVPVTINIDNVEEKWWVSFSLEEIGYIPAFDFPMFYEGLVNVFGGLVAYTSPEFTSTQMGSGYYPSAGIGYTGLIGNYFGINSNGVRALDPPMGSIVTQPSCYDYGDIGFLPGPGAGYYIGYGGSGGEYCDGTSP